MYKYIRMTISVYFIKPQDEYCARCENRFCFFFSLGRDTCSNLHVNVTFYHLAFTERLEEKVGESLDIKRQTP